MTAEYQEKRAEYRNEISRAKRDSWNQFVSSTDNLHAMARLGKILRHHPRYEIGLVKRKDGSFTDTAEESLRAVAEQSFPDSIPLPSKEERKAAVEELSLKEGPFIPKEQPYFTQERITEAISSFTPLKAAGPDDLQPITLQSLPADAIDVLRQIYNACHTIGYTPECWRKAKVVMIPKIGKADYSEAKSFRPISLTSFLFKTMEKITSWEIQTTSLKDKPIDSRQHPFQSVH